MLGAPGVGKTTLIRQAARMLSSSWWSRRQLDRPFRTCLPILLTLQDHIAAIHTQPNVSLETLLAGALLYSGRRSTRSGQSMSQGDQPQRYTLPQSWITRQLRRGGCVVLLDGLDNIYDAGKRKALVRWIQSRMSQYPRCRFVVTSRPAAYSSNPLEGHDIFAVSGLESADIKEYIRDWYLSVQGITAAAATAVPAAAAAWAVDQVALIYDKIRQKPMLMQFAANPLLLEMLLTVHHSHQTLPEGRAVLYRQVCELFLAQRRDAHRGRPHITSEQSLSILRPLAFHLMKTADRFRLDDVSGLLDGWLARLTTQGRFDSVTFLGIMESGSGLLVKTEDGGYQFAHKTFQEYLAAAHVAVERLEGDLLKEIRNPEWHETIRLYAAQRDATPVLVKALEDAETPLDVLSLAIDCEAEGAEAAPEVRDRFKKYLHDAVADRDPARRRLVCNALVQSRLRRMPPLLTPVYVDFQPITVAEYRMYVEDGGLIALPWVFRRKGEPVDAREPALGLPDTEAERFSRWFTRRYGVGGVRYRLPKYTEVASHYVERDRAVTTPGCWTIAESSDRRQPGRLPEKLAVSVRRSTEFVRHQARHDPFVAAACEGREGIGSVAERLEQMLAAVWEDKARKGVQLKSTLKAVVSAREALTNALYAVLRETPDLIRLGDIALGSGRRQADAGIASAAMGVVAPRGSRREDDRLRQDAARLVGRTVEMAERIESSSLERATARELLFRSSALILAGSAMGVQSSQECSRLLLELYADVVLYRDRIEGEAEPYESVLIARISTVQERSSSANLELFYT